MMKYFLTLCLLLVLCQCVQLERAAARDAANASNRLPVPPTRARFALPKFFNFKRYKRTFNKRYKSILQELVRQKIFLARAFAAFISAVNYKYRKSDYYLGINEMSDRTAGELAQRVNNKLVRRYKERRLMRTDSLDPRELDKELQYIMREGEDGGSGYQEIAVELEQAAKVRRKRDTGPRDVTIDQLLDSTDSSSPDSDKLVGSIPSNNINYEPVEVPSFGIKDFKELPELSEDEIDLVNATTGEEYLAQERAKLAKASNQQTLSLSFTRFPSRKGVSEDVVYVDHRKSGCLLRPRDQGFCGSCYIFSSIALLEWIHCVQTGKLVAFSEQYAIDCGFRHGLGGCEGGSEDKVSEFISKFGIELQRNYPYTGIVSACPYPKNADPKTMGYLRIAGNGFRRVKPERLENALRRRPITLHVDVPFDFDFYKAGVHSGKRCNPEGTHALLLVGSGRQEGQEYWLFRNSYSHTWGEGGYFKLNKKSQCILVDDIWTTEVNFDKFLVKNEQYNPFMGSR